MTALSQAFEAAGYRKPEDRLARALQKAAEAPGGWDARMDALAAAIRGDAEVLWLAFAPVRKARLQDMLADAAREKREREAREQRLREVATQVGGGQRHVGNHLQHAALDTTGLHGELIEPKRVDLKHRLAGAVLSERAHEVLREKRQAGLEVALASRQDVARRTLLDTFLIDGTPIGQATAGYARKWAKERGQQFHFVTLLTNGLQPDMVIGQHIKPDEAERCMRRAGELAHA